MSVRALIVASWTLVWVAAAPAAAQSPAAGPASARGRTVAVGGVLTGPSSAGAADAHLLGGSGSPTVRLFTANNRLATGFGLEADISLRIRRTFRMEIGGGWTRTNISTRIENDFEGADADPIESPLSRFTVEGAGLWHLRDRGDTLWFIRAAAGWMRETAGGATLTGDGLMASGGLGLRRWFRTPSKPGAARVGLRVEGRAVIRTGGISLGEGGVRFGPAAVALVIFGSGH